MSCNLVQYMKMTEQAGQYEQERSANVVNMFDGTVPPADQAEHI